MKLTYLKRRGGKTMQAVKEAKETGAILVVIDRSRKRQMMEEHGFPEWMLMTHEEFFDERAFDRLRGIRFAGEMGMPEFIIDDLDSMILRMPPFGRVRRVTMSKPFTKLECLKMGISTKGSRT